MEPLNYGDMTLMEKKSDEYPLNCTNYYGATLAKPQKKEKEKEQCVSKNLLTERRRRKKINDGMLALRALVPRITKMDKASTLGDACDYIQDLMQNIENYQDELLAMEEEDLCKVEEKGQNNICSNDRNLVKEEIEVITIGPREFMVKIIFKKRQCGFSKLLEALNALGLQVIDVNVTTLNGIVMNNLNVLAGKKNLQANSLKDTLTRLIFGE